jgi:DNA-binding CsgD family transcriptional regulator
MLRDLDAIAAAFAEAAVDPGGWVAAVEVAAHQTGSFGAALLPLAGRLPSLPYTSSMEDSAESYFGGGWHARDERARGADIMRRRGVIDDFDITTPEVMRRHPYYQDFLGRHGLQWFAGVRMACDRDLWALTIQRTPAQGPFSPEDLARLAALSGRLASAAAVARALGFARAEAALEAFSASGTPVALIDRTARVIRMNDPAEGLLGRDLRLAERRLTSTDPGATIALDRALHALLWERPGPGLAPPVVLPRPGRRPVVAYPLRPPAVVSDILVACQGMLVLADLDARPRAPADQLRAIFGLTPAEARLGAAVGRGLSPREAAGRLGITEETARKTLKRVLAKSGAARQSELVALFGRLVGGTDAE